MALFLLIPFPQSYWTRRLLASEFLWYQLQIEVSCSVLNYSSETILFFPAPTLSHTSIFLIGHTCLLHVCETHVNL